LVQKNTDRRTLSRRRTTMRRRDIGRRRRVHVVMMRGWGAGLGAITWFALI
jgi:hypothetical protein